MPSPDLAAIEARAAAATEGPWEVDVAIEGDTRHLGIASPKGGVVPVATNVEWGTFETAIYEEADAEFIAHARTDVPALIARIRELEAENAKIDDLDEALRQRDREILGLRRENHNLARNLGRNGLGRDGFPMELEPAEAMRAEVAKLRPPRLRLTESPSLLEVAHMRRWEELEAAVEKAIGERCGVTFQVGPTIRDWSVKVDPEVQFGQIFRVESHL